MDTKELLTAFEKRDEKLIERLATMQRKSEEHEAEIFEILQKMSRGTGGGAEQAKSLGEQFTESDAFKAFEESGFSKGARADLLLKTTLTSATSNAAGSVGAGLPTRFEDIDALPRRDLRVRSLLPQIRVTQPSIEVPVQKARNNNAAPVAEGAAKPESDIQLELKTFPTRTIAHWMKASRQVLDDIPQLRGLIDTELLWGLGAVEDAQLLNGDGTGQNLHGLIPQATAYAEPVSVGEINEIDVIGLAALQVSLADYLPDGVVMHPADWLKMRLTKSTTGEYLFGAPGAPVEPRLFGLPVVPTVGMTQGKFLVGQFRVAGTIYDRWEARVETGYVNDDFTHNLVTVLAEERLSLAVKRGAALVYGDFTEALAA